MSTLFKSETVVAALIALVGAFAGAYAGIQVGKQQYEIQRAQALVDLVTKMNVMETPILSALLDRLSKAKVLEPDDMDALCKAFKHPCAP